MFAIISIYIMLLSFIVIIVSSLCYLVYVDWSAKRFDIRVNKIHSEFSRAVLADLDAIEKEQRIDENRINYVMGKLKRRAYERVFQNSVILYANYRPKGVIPHYTILFEEYLLKKVRTVKPNGTVSHVQNIFMLGEYRYNHRLIIEYLLKSVQSQSMITRFNSMSAISKIGDADALVKSLIMVSNQRRYMNMKVLTDVIDNFEGDKKLLNIRLVSVFKQINIELRLLIISYFTNEKSTEARDIFAQSLLEVTDKEEYIRLLKYFGVISNHASLPKIIESLTNDSWEIRAIAAKSLANYSEILVLKDVMISLSDDNWYVRTNAASSILNHLYDDKHFSDKDLEMFMVSLDDKYAMGALEYARHLHVKPIEVTSS